MCNIGRADDVHCRRPVTTLAQSCICCLCSAGSLHDHTFLASKLRHLLGDTTFQEAYERTGRVLNISVCPADTNEPSRLLNYLTAPHVCIWSAVACSSAFPYLFSAQHLWGKDTRRGGLVR